MIDEFQANGQYTFTRHGLEAVTTRSEVSLQSALRRLKKQGRIVSPRRGFYVIVPLEHQIAKSPPPSWFIDDLMAYLEQPYYVGLLSAAAIHGAAHQQPMVFQVVTDRPTRPVRTGRTRIEFHRSHQVCSIPVADVQTETGTMPVSTPEATAFDLVHYGGAAGSLSNIATVVGELVDEMDGDALVETAALYSMPDSQRLGYIMDTFGVKELAAELASYLEGQRHRSVLLSPGDPQGNAARNSRWMVIENAAIESDL